MKKNHALKKSRPRGQMKALTFEQVALIGASLAQKKEWRALAMFRLAIDSMLRASDLVAVKVPEITATDGSILAEIVTGQEKTGGGVSSALMPQTREAVARWLKERSDKWSVWLFPGKGVGEHITESQYRRDAKTWFALAHLDTKFYSTHSLRRTKAALIYASTGNMEAVRQLLGHASLQATSRYLGVETADALRIAREIKI